MKCKASVTLGLVVGLWSAGCASDPQPRTPEGAPSLPRAQEKAAMSEAEAKAGLTFEVESTGDTPSGPARAKVAVTRPLDAAAVGRLLGRLEPLAEAEAVDFKLPTASRPAPKAGETVKTPFPPPAAPDATAPEQAGGPQAVLRYAPEGDVELVPRVSVTFAQPVVPISGVADVESLPRPVKLTPEPEGQWRWVGTRTVVFEPTTRMPMATTYSVEATADGEPTRFTFQTPPARLVEATPSGRDVSTRPVLALLFDQRVSPEAVQAHLQVKAGSTPVTLRPATLAELEADPQAKALRARAEAPERVVLLTPTAPLPTDAAVQVVLPRGLPSAEGPRVTEKVQQHGFQTYAALALESAECGWGDQCRPFMPWTLRFNNRLDEASVDASRFTVTPEVPDLKVEVYDRVVTLTGLTRGRTEYTVALSPQLTDQFGQRLGETKPVTFKVGPAEPALFVGHDPLLVLDPAGPRQLSVHLVNHDAVKVRIWRVSPAAWPAYLEWRDAGRRQDALTGGELVQDGEVKTGCPQDALHELGLPLDAALSDGLGHAVVEVSALPRNLSGWQKENPPTERLWVQSTRLGLDVFRDPGHLLVWATRLGDGAPKGGVKVQLAPAQASAATGDDGLATLALPEAWKTRSAWVEVRDGADVAFLPETTWRGYGTQWSLRVLQDNLRIFTFDDRGLYRPGEKVSVKGWLRTITPGPKGDVAPAPAGGKLIWRAKDPRGSELAKGVATLSAFGGFELELSIPADANLGYASVELDGAGPARGAHHVHGFQIQEFRRPEFEVSARATEGPYVLGDRPVLTAEARYFAGGALAGATTRWSLSAQPGHFSPPGQDDFQFGHSVPWWWDRGEDGGGSSYRSAEGLTDATGAHRLKLSLDALSPPRPYVLSAEATVEDVNHQAWSARTELLVHPGQLYVGLRPARTFVEAGEPLAVAAVVADLEGRRVAGRQVDLQAERLEWVRGRGDWRQEVAEVIPCPLTSAAEPATCTLTPEKGGQYRLRARVKDDAGRLNETLTLVWVSGQQRLPDRDLEELKVELVPDKDQYQPGDVARILVVAPFAHAQGLLTLRREGLLSESRFEVDGSTHTLEVPITEGHLPSLELAVHLVGAMPRGEDLPERPAFAAGRLTLPVPATVRALTVSATPKAAALRPGEATEVAVQVTDAQGAGVEAEVALVVVDEAVLALAGYALQDPLTAFYAGRSGDVADYRLRSHVRLANPEALAGAGRGGGGAPGGALRKTSGAMPPAPAMEMMREASVGAADGAFGGAPPEATPIAVRKDFSALALFAPAVRTDAAGRAKVPVKVPDNLTRYRVMAVAVDAGRRFGKGEAQLVARLPLMVRPAPPRFARFGDTFELPVVLENQSERPLDAQVALRAANLELTGGAGFTASVPAQDRVEVRFNVAAARPGEARFQVAAASGPDADAATLAFPVYTPATTEAFATYGTLTKDAVRQPVARPKDAVTSFGGLEVSTASTQLQALTDAFIYLYEYPYGCSEQVASRLLSVTALKDVLQAFHAPGLPEASALTAAVNRDLEKLTRLQNQDGGWGFWRVGQPSWPFLSVHVAHALFRAEAAGYAVPKGTLHRAHEHIRAIERYIPGDYSPRARRAIMAYALYARALRGDLDDRTAQVILRDEGGVTKADMEILGWLYPVLIDGKDAQGALRDLRRQLATRVTEEAGTAHFVTGYSEGAHLLLHSDRRVDGLLLEGVLMDTPESDLIPKLAAGLLAHRVQGRWHNTQESVWVLLALNRYFRSYEKVTPDFVARVWLGDGFAGEHRFQGRTTETHQVDIPMAAVPATETPLWIAKDGPGRLYYRVGMRYAPQDLRLAPLERGFSVVRRYAGVDDPADVRQDADGTWRIKAGATVKVSLQMVAPSRRYHVALMDPLPAGLEPLNPALAMSPTPPPDPAAPDRAPYGWWWYRPWYEHENLRDDRVEAFAALLWEGVHDYTYYARATTPGRFVASPTKAEEMYAPEVFGRSGTDVVVVE